MTPLYEKGGVVYVTKISEQEVQKGDVIAYISSSDSDIAITHRVIEINDDTFITKGDANNTLDPEPILKSRLIGKVAYYVPYLGTLAYFITTVNGKLSVAIVFLTALALFFMSEIFKKNAPPVDLDKQKKRANIPLVAGIVLMAVAVCYLGYVFIGYGISRNTYADLRKQVWENGSSEAGKPSLNGNASGQGKTSEGDLNLDAGNAVNPIYNFTTKYPDMVGWISIPGTPVDYPIMQGDDDSYYLRRDYKGNYSANGSIFMNCNNTISFVDRYTIIYGHNMRDDSMFGTLLNYKDIEYFNEHPTITIYTREKELTYEIFSAYGVSASDSIYSIFYITEDDFKPVLDKIVSSSVIDTGVKATPSDHVILLSTCSNSGATRFVVAARRVDE